MPSETPRTTIGLSVVMPAFNEERTISEIVERVLAVPQLRQLVIVDDGSTDRTHDILSKLAVADRRIDLIQNEQNLGKTGSIKRGFDQTTGDIVMVQDADLEYDPADMPRIIEVMAAEDADVVYGSRFLERSSRDLPYYSFFIANKAITFFSNLLSGRQLSDVQTCYIAFRGGLLRDMIVTSERFGFEVEAAAKLAKLDLNIVEVPISYNPRTYEAGKKLGWRHGFAALWYIVKYNLFTSAGSSFRSDPPATDQGAR